MDFHESPSPQPLITRMWDRFVREIRARETSAVLEKLHGIGEVLSVAGVPETDDVDTPWLLMRNVNEEMLYEACHRILRTHEKTYALRATFALIRFLGWTDLIETIRETFASDRCDNKDRLEAILTLEAFGAITDAERDMIDGIAVDASVNRNAENSTEVLEIDEDWLPVLARNATPLERKKLTDILVYLGDDIPETPEVLTALSILHAQGEDISDILETIGRQSWLGTEMFSHSGTSLDTLFVDAGLPLPLARWIGEESLTSDADEILYRRLLNDRSFTRSQKIAIQNALDTIEQGGDAPPAFLVLAYSLAGGEYDRVRTYLDSDDWKLRTAAYWAIGEALDDDEASKRMEDELDSDAEEVLSFVRADTKEWAMRIASLANSEYPIVSVPIQSLTDAPFDSATRTDLVHRFINTFTY